MTTPEPGGTPGTALPLRERWWRDGSMVVESDGPDQDDNHFVADAATDDDAQRLVDWHNGAMDLAAAHDRQPYPTAWAYEQACRARDEWQAKAAEATRAERERIVAAVEGLPGVMDALYRSCELRTDVSLAAVLALIDVDRRP